jgi:hypothetical protein
LSACSSIPFIGDSKEPKKPSFEQSVFTEAEPRQNAELQNEIEDFKSMKSSLNRLVALESDLNFLLDEMSRFNEKNPVMYQEAEQASARPEQVNSEVVFSADGRTETAAAEQTADGWSRAAENMADKWQSQASEMNSLRLSRDVSTRAQSRNPSTSQSNTNLSAPSNVDNSKFSGSRKVDVAAAKPIMQVNSQNSRQVQAPSQSQSQKNSGAVDSSKFSYGTDPKQIIGDVGSCREWKVDSVKTYSLHLASYKSRKAAEDGWNKLNAKYADIWCETEAKLAKVVVKGTEYLSLRVGGYKSRDKVLQLCSVVKEQGDYCAVSATKGEAL